MANAHVIAKSFLLFGGSTKLYIPSAIKTQIIGIMTGVHGCVKSTVIERRQHQLGRMADFQLPVTFSVFDL